MMLDSCEMLQKQSEAFHTFLWYFFPSLKHNFIAYRSSKVSSRPDCIFEIHLLWQSGFSRVYSNCCCSYWFEFEIIKMGQSSQKKYRNNILNFQESTTILNSWTKKVWKHIEFATYLTRVTAQVFILLIIVLLHRFVSTSFRVLLRYSFLFFLSSPLVCWCEPSRCLIVCSFPFLRAF